MIGLHLKTNNSTSAMGNSHDCHTASDDYLSLAVAIANSVIRCQNEIKVKIASLWVVDCFSCQVDDKRRSSYGAVRPRPVMQLGCPDLQRHLCQKSEVNKRIFASQAFKDFKIYNFLRYLIDKLGEENEREKKAFKKFLETNAASLKNNATCTPVNKSNVSNNCHIVYMDGSPSYPATGASVINLSQGAQAR